MIIQCFSIATCPPLSLENGEVEYDIDPVDGEYPTDTLAFFTCNTCNGDFIRLGSLYVRCQDSGTWNLDMPTCVNATGTAMYTFF